MHVCVWELSGCGKEPTCQCRRHREMQIISLGQKDPLGEGMTTYSSILAWRIPWTEGACQATVHRVTKSWTRLKQLSTHAHRYMNGCMYVQSCPALCNPMDCSPWGSSVHRILQARILEWVAIPFSMGYSWPRDQTQSPALHTDSLSSEPPGKHIVSTNNQLIAEGGWDRAH